MSIDPFPTEEDALARLDELARRRAEAQAAGRAVLDEIKAVLFVAGTQPFDRSRLIEHSGLSRRTAYRVLPPRPSEGAPSREEWFGKPVKTAL